MNVKFKNQAILYSFCTILGAFTGMIIWIFLKAVYLGTSFIWEYLPKTVHIPFYTILICTSGGFLIGILHKKYGNYPEDLSTVISKMKTEKFYDYHNIIILIISALFPLIIGSSVGPEAGLTGIIMALCCWAGENLKSAHKNANEYSEIGMAVTLSVLFHSPLFGIFAVEEDKEKEFPELTISSKIFIYGLALAGGTGTYLILGAVFGTQIEGFPSFPAFEPKWIDYPMIIIYIICGCLLANFYQLCHHISHKTAGKIPVIARETIGGLCLGITGLAVPLVMFSGEEEISTLINSYSKYIPLYLIGISFLKILITNICIESGLKGGHFFPAIFAGVCLGYGISSLIFQESSRHVVLGAAIVTAALLGGIMKKPLAVTMLLFLCFPVKLFVWIFVAALIGSKGVVKFKW